MVKPFLIFGCG